MFTQCPQCDAIFLLSASQLKAANGDVRCGQCLSVFNALDHLSEDLPATQETEDPTHKTNRYDNGTGKTPDNVTNTDGPAARQTDAGTDDSDIFNDIINEANRHDVPVEEIDRFEEFLATNALPAENAPATDGFSPVKHSQSTDDSLPANGSLLADSSLLAENTTLTGETNFGDIDAVTAALDTDISVDNSAFSEFAVYPDKPEDEVWRSNKVDTDLESITIGTPDTVVPEKNSQAETVHASEEQSSSANETQTVNVPNLILDELHAARAEQLRPSNTPWIIGSLLLMFTLVSQVMYYSRDELAKDADLRPWLIQMCKVLNCTLRQPYDIKQIEIIGRDVRSHPSADNALVVSTSLINTATFVQPFPLLTMVFSDINGTKIAQRRFTPHEYLSNTIDLDTGMTPNMPVRIDLELVDPGKAAVNYEFHAEINPLQTRPLT